VIGRTAEVHMLAHLSAAALERGFTRMRGIYVPGPRNALVADVYPRLGFVACDDGCWEYDLSANGPIESNFISDANAT
jgi:predicted enzyme involved in methoxymalonyl-ACP biosynthesis